jgi:hypothetical protein
MAVICPSVYVLRKGKRKLSHFAVRLNGSLVAHGVGNTSHLLNSARWEQPVLMDTSMRLHSSARHLVLEGLGEGNHFILITFHD